ncbi:hypothetical protein Taro_039744 [Colocasia esculenta]|uniref:Uncharacterized protein n=1 Tax=Colocasia esculenta TaxID=4460 RepID=A0A843WSE5_COLES|nr:hypothetical protein [Colocasia esculenta]
MSRDLHMAAYYLHPTYHYAMKLLYDDDLTTVFTRVVERLSRSALDAADYNMRLRVKHLTDDPKWGEVEYDPVDIGFLRDNEDPMVAWVARVTTERGEYELDEEADDLEDPPRPNTFLARVVEATEEEEGEHGDVGHPHSSQFRAKADDEVDLLGDLRMERAMSSRVGANLDDEVDIQRLKLGPATHS